MIASNVIWRFSLPRYSQRCKGVFVSEDLDMSDELDLLFNELEFKAPILTGKFCKIYIRSDVTVLYFLVRKCDKIIVFVSFATETTETTEKNL